EKRVFLVILFTSFSGSLVSRISGAVHYSIKTLLINDALTICEIVFRPGVRFVYVVTGKSSSQGFLVS
ncbi:hypothetical protein, partial [Escherichia coli]|uniref:hypothetical protein n=1 Tax=Escherichia coli TaxID=562 RepID=UPI001BC89BC2